MNESDPEFEDSGLEIGRLIREVRHRLESLERAGLRALPRSAWQSAGTGKAPESN